MSHIENTSKERLESSKYAVEVWLQRAKDEVVKYETQLKEITEALKNFGSEAVEAVQDKTDSVVETVKEEVKKAAPKRTTKKAAAKAEEKTEDSGK